MTVMQLKEILDLYFSQPFLPHGHVQTKWVDTKHGRVLEIRIGRRDIWVNYRGRVVGAGTDLTKS